MLVLSRLRGQSIIIGGEITVTVADIRGDKVRLGIDARRDVSIHRKEIYDQIEQANLDSASMAPEDVPVGLSGSKSVVDSKNNVTPRDPFLIAAIDQARKSAGLPIGAVLVRNNQIIGSGYDHRIQNNNPVACAVLECLKRAGRQKTYGDTVLYSTLMPGRLGLVAAVNYGISKIIIGDGVHALTRKSQSDHSHGTEVVDMHDAECIHMVARFIHEHVDLWNEMLD